MKMSRRFTAAALGAVMSLSLAATPAWADTTSTNQAPAAADATASSYRFSYPSTMVETSYTVSVTPEFWNAATGDKLPAAPAGHTFAIGQPNDANGWSTPSWVTVSQDGTVTATPPWLDEDVDVVVPIVMTETATGRTTTATVSISVIQDIYNDISSKSSSLGTLDLAFSADSFIKSIGETIFYGSSN